MRWKRARSFCTGQPSKIATGTSPSAPYSATPCSPSSLDLQSTHSSRFQTALCLRDAFTIPAHHRSICCDCAPTEQGLYHEWRHGGICVRAMSVVYCCEDSIEVL